MPANLAFRFLLAALFSAIFFAKTNAQALPVAIDGLFDDWQGASVTADPAGDGASLDLLELAIANDEARLFLKIKLAQEVNLTGDAALLLYLNTDNNFLTGEQASGFGAECVLDFANREARFFHSGSASYDNFYSVGFSSLPTVSGNEFEIALERAALPDGVHPLFTGDLIRLVWKGGGDALPDNGATISYTFDNSAVTPYQPVVFEKTNDRRLRLLTWNTLNDGLADDARFDSFLRVVVAVNPDMATFNECWDLTAQQVIAFMNLAIPLPGAQNWSAVKLDAGNVTASRFPITQSWQIQSGYRLTASLIDLPADFATDILLVNGHLKCCGDGDGQRQKEADAFAKFILDAKSPGGVINLPVNTPFVLSGDMNLVAKNAPLNTLLTGDIVNTNTYGPGAPLDWDGTDLQDVISLHADDRMAFTWRNDGDIYPPSRLDYCIISNSVMSVDKAFTIETEIMPQDRLAMYGLDANDTYFASDHLPKVTDLLLPLTTGVAEVESADLQVFPNPFTEGFSLKMAAGNAEIESVFLKKMDGTLLATFRLSGGSVQASGLESLPAGVYFLEWKYKGSLFHKKVVKR